MTNLEWEIMRSLSDVQGDQKAVASTIEGFDFTGFGHAQAIALDVFELTRDNVKNHLPIAKKLAGFDDAVGLRVAFRLALLRELISDVESGQRNSMP